MTLKEFVKQYYLHDSLITMVTFDANKCEADITLEFSYWMQENYVDGDPETGIVQLHFVGITSFEDGGVLGEIDYFSILDALVEQNELILNILDDFHSEYYTMKISADSVEVRELGKV